MISKCRYPRCHGRVLELPAPSTSFKEHIIFTQGAHGLGYLWLEAFEGTRRPFRKKVVRPDSPSPLAPLSGQTEVRLEV